MWTPEGKVTCVVGPVLVVRAGRVATTTGTNSIECESENCPSDLDEFIDSPRVRTTSDDTST